MKVCRNGCLRLASPLRDDGLCHVCRHNESKRSHRKKESAPRIPRPVKPRTLKCGVCNGKFEFRFVIGGLCGTCRIDKRRREAIDAPTPTTVPCSVMKCRRPAELGGRTCLEHRPMFENVMVAPRPSALDFLRRDAGAMFEYPDPGFGGDE